MQDFVLLSDQIRINHSVSLVKITRLVSRWATDTRKLSLRVKIYVVNYRKVVNIGIPRGRQPGRGAGMFNGSK